MSTTQTKAATFRRRFPLPRKESFLVVRLTDHAKEELRLTAWRKGLTMSAYILALHRAALGN